MGQYNSTYDFVIEESSNKKNDKYYFNGNTTTIPLKFYKYNYDWGLYMNTDSNEDIFKTYLLL
jgi:hypothetical protein